VAQAATNALYLTELAGHLLVLSNACRQMIDQPLPVAAVLAGIGDGIALTREAAGAIGDERRSQTSPVGTSPALGRPRASAVAPRRPKLGGPWRLSRRTSVPARGGVGRAEGDLVTAEAAWQLGSRVRDLPLLLIHRQATAFRRSPSCPTGGQRTGTGRGAAMLV
jgi:hypothetical protein